MNIRHKIDTLLHTKRIFWKKLAGSFVFQYFPDKWALKIIYHNIFERPLNLDNPQTFNEKLQWLKLYNRNPLYTMLVDKYAVKEWVANKIGEEYIIPTYGVWESFDQIDFDKLPNQFVLKTTHAGGSTGVVICRDKSSFDFANAKARLTASLKSNTYLIGREWPYKNVPHRILAEKYVDPTTGTNDLPDYKFLCFNGRVKCSFVCTERYTGDVKVTFFDREWNVMPFERNHPKSTKTIPKPDCYFEMIQLAEKLSKGIPFVRVDLYEVLSENTSCTKKALIPEVLKKKIFFGELTFFPGGGCEKFQPEEWDYIFGEWIHLPSIN